MWNKITAVMINSQMLQLVMSPALARHHYQQMIPFWQEVRGSVSL